MKNLFILCSLLFATQSFAGKVKKITCEEGDYKVEINYAQLGNGNKQLRVPFWTLFRKDVALKPYFNTFTNVESGYEGSFLNSYLFGFESNDAVIAVAIPGLKTLAPGFYPEAKSDLFVSLGQEVMDGSTVNCAVEIIQ